MVKHVVMWKLKEFAENGTKAENALKVKALVEGLKAKIPQIVSIEIGLDFSGKEGAFDVCLVSEFRTRNDLEAYQKHPEHLTVAEYIGHVRDKRVLVDYEVVG